MKLCDSCGQKDDGHHNSVGGVLVKIEGYHWNHWSHKNKNQNWPIDLCPKCADKLKGKIEGVISKLISPNNLQ